MLGAGNDRFGWDPGDDNDLILGGDGTDTLDFDGAGIGEEIVISASGATSVLERDIAAVRMNILIGCVIRACMPIRWASQDSSQDQNYHS